MTVRLCTIAITALVTIGNTRYDWDRHIWDFHLENFVGKAQQILRRHF
jgi:hypothetical protein